MLPGNTQSAVTYNHKISKFIRKIARIKTRFIISFSQTVSHEPYEHPLLFSNIYLQYLLKQYPILLEHTHAGASNFQLHNNFMYVCLSDNNMHDVLILSCLNYLKNC